MGVVLQFKQKDPAPGIDLLVSPDSVSIKEAAEMFASNRGLAAVLTHYGTLHRDGRLVDHAGVMHYL